MKQILLMITVLALVGCVSAPKVVPNSPEAKAAIEAAIREQLKKPTGDLTKTDLEKVKLLYLGDNGITDVSALTGFKKLNVLFLSGNQLTNVRALRGLKKLKVLSLANNQLTNVSALAKLKELERLSLEHNPRLTKAEIDKLQKALPNCSILHNAKESAADIIVDAPIAPAQGVPTEGLVRINGQGTVKYKGAEFIVNTKLVMPGGGPLVLPAIFIDGKKQQIEASVAADVILNGVSIGTAPAALQAPVGLSTLKVSRQGFKPYNRIINITEGLKLDLNLEMTDEGYAKWKEQIQFFQDLETERKYVEGDIERMKIEAEALKKHGFLIKLDTNEGIRFQKKNVRKK